MERRRNNLACNLFVQRTQGIFLPMVLNNKLYTYCTVKPAGGIKQAVDARESSGSRCTFEVRLMTANFGTWVLSNATRYREIDDKEGLCIKCLHGDMIKNQYSTFTN